MSSTTAASTAGLVASLLDEPTELPQSAAEAARRLVLDFLGVAIAGARTDEGQTVARAVVDMEPAGECGVPVVGRCFSPATAALICGTMGYSIGLTDTHASSITHPGPSVIPAVLAVGQATGADGEQMLHAITLGVEAIARIGAAVNPSHRARGFHPTATCNHFGVALATSVLLGSDLERTLWSLGIAGSMAGGLYEFRQSGSMLMALHGGWPAHGGIHAGYLAATGFSGPDTVLEGPEGFLRAFADETRPEALTRDPGETWLIEDLSMRPYCACRYAHAGIDALGQIRASTPVATADIEALTVWTHRTAVEQETEPTTLVSARLCTAFNMALAVVHGPRLAEVEPEDLVDPELLAVMERIDVREDPALTAMFPEKWSCRVEIRTRAGETLERQVDVPKGDPANPMTDVELEDKFTRLSEPVLGQRQSGRIVALVREFERIDLSELWSAATPSL